MKFEILLEPATEGGFTAICPVLRGCVSEGDTKSEALKNIKDAIALYMRAVKKEEKLLLKYNRGSELLTVAVNA